MLLLLAGTATVAVDGALWDGRIRTLNVTH